MIRCTECQAPAIKMIGAFHSWSWLLHYFEVERLQGDITEDTFQTACDKLLAVRHCIDRIDEQNEEAANAEQA